MPRKATRTFFTNISSTAPGNEIIGPAPNIIEVDIANIDSVNAINLFGSAGDPAGFPIDAGQKAIFTEEDGDDVKNGFIAVADNATVTVRVRVVTLVEDS